MKILLANTIFYPEINGVVIYIANLAQELEKLGHKVTIFAGSKITKRETFKGIPVIKFQKPEKKEDIKKFYKCFEINAEKEINKLENNYDLVICRSHTLLKPLKNKFKGKEIINIIPALKSTSKLFCTKKQTKLMRTEINASIKNVKLITLSKNMKKQVQNKLKAKNLIKVIPPGIDLKKFKPTKKKKKFILSLGRIAPEKNIKSLISVFSKIKIGKLLIVGDGPEKKELMNIAHKSKRRKDIKFLKTTNKPKKCYSKSKIFILPSNYEPFGHVLLEAMASGLPCIAFKPDGKKIITASDEIIKDRKTGFLVKDEKEMAKKIDLLLSDDKLREKMGKQARKEAEKYSWKKCAEEILRFAKE